MAELLLLRYTNTQVETPTDFRNFQVGVGDDDVVFGTRFSNLYTAVDTPAWAVCVTSGSYVPCEAV
jgi:hypothetical protein